MESMKIVILSILILCFAGFVGCAYIPQEVTLTPETHVIESNTGKGLKVSVTVKDERPSMSLGFRRSGWGRGSEITTAQNMEEL